jgi:hypothetical protein
MKIRSFSRRPNSGPTLYQSVLSCSIKRGVLPAIIIPTLLAIRSFYILMRESMKNEESITEPLFRGLKEEFGAIAKPVAFLGCQSGFLSEGEQYKRIDLDKSEIAKRALSYIRKSKENL